MADKPEEEKKKPEIDLSGRTSWLGKIDAGMRAAANFVTFGYADKLDAMMSSGSYKDNMERNKAINDFDEENNTAAVRTGQVGITVVAAAPGLVKAAVGKTIQAGSAAFAKATGRTAAAETAAAGQAARAAAAEAASARAAAEAAAKAAKEATKEAAKAAKPTTLGGRAKSIAGKAVKAGVGFGVPVVVADTLIESATGERSDKSQTTEEITAADGKTLQGGASAVASAMTLVAVAPGVRAFAERVGEHMVDRMGGRFKSVFELGKKLSDRLPDSIKKPIENAASHLGDLAHSGATSVAKGLGLAYVGSEVVASQYASDSNSNHPSAIVQTLDAVRDAYTDLKRAGLAQGKDATISGAFVVAFTVGMTELAEGFVPGVASIDSKERRLLTASDVDYSNPHTLKLLAMHMGSDLHQIDIDANQRLTLLDAKYQPMLKAPGMPANAKEWNALLPSLTPEQMEAHPYYQYEIARMGLEQEQRRAMQAFDQRWAPVNQSIDNYLTSGKADFTNPKVAALAYARMQDDKAAVQREYEIRTVEEGTLDYAQSKWMFEPAVLQEMDSKRDAQIAALQVKWLPVGERVDALTRPQHHEILDSATPEAHVVAQVPAAETAQPARAAPPVAPPARRAQARPPVAPATAVPVVAAAPAAFVGPELPVGDASPQESFNEQAALPQTDPDPAIAAAYAAAYAAAQGSSVTLGGLAPGQVTLPPLVGAGTLDEGVLVDTSALHGVVEPAVLPEPAPEPLKPTMALNSRAPSVTSNFG